MLTRRSDAAGAGVVDGGGAIGGMAGVQRCRRVDLRASQLRGYRVFAGVLAVESLGEPNGIAESFRAAMEVHNAAIIVNKMCSIPSAIFATSNSSWSTRDSDGEGL